MASVECGAMPPRPDEWTVAHVKNFLVAIGLPELEPVFEAHEVTGEVLLSLSEEDAEWSLGIKKFGLRRRLSLALQDLKEGLELGPGNPFANKRWDGFTKSTSASLTFTTTEFSQLEDGSSASSQPSPLCGFAPSRGSHERLSQWSSPGLPRIESAVIWHGCTTPRTPAQAAKSGDRSIPSSASRGQLHEDEILDVAVQEESGGVIGPSPSTIPRISTRLVPTPPWPSDDATIQKVDNCHDTDTLITTSRQLESVDETLLDAAEVQISATKLAVAASCFAVIPPGEKDTASTDGDKVEIRKAEVVTQVAATVVETKPCAASPIRMFSLPVHVPEPAARVTPRMATAHPPLTSPGQRRPLARFTSQPSAWPVPARTSPQLLSGATGPRIQSLVAPPLVGAEDALQLGSGLEWPRTRRSTTPISNARPQRPEQAALAGHASPALPSSRPSSVLVGHGSVKSAAGALGRPAAQVLQPCASPPAPMPAVCAAWPPRRPAHDGCAMQPPAVIERSDQFRPVSGMHHPNQVRLSASYVPGGVGCAPSAQHSHPIPVTCSSARKG
mmetsp:Transcript_41617/g.75484  ORF Transcript_41617/g.75484 Transcript_41617/m.75484 type:complete len:558 (+) Transcript_41617:104-1777(+)